VVEVSRREPERMELAFGSQKQRGRRLHVHGARIAAFPLPHHVDGGQRLPGRGGRGHVAREAERVAAERRPEVDGDDDDVRRPPRRERRRAGRQRARRHPARRRRRPLVDPGRQVARRSHTRSRRRRRHSRRLDLDIHADAAATEEIGAFQAEAAGCLHVQVWDGYIDRPLSTFRRARNQPASLRFAAVNFDAERRIGRDIDGLFASNR